METTILTSELQKLADVHNLALENARDNFTGDETITSPEAALNFVKTFNQNFVFRQFPNLSPEETQIMTESFERQKADVVSSQFITRHLIRKFTSDTSGGDDLVGKVNEALTKGVIDEKSHEMLSRLHNANVDNFHGLLSSSDYNSFLTVLKNEYENLNFVQEPRGWELVGGAIYIARASFDWWNDHPDAGSLPVIINPTISARVAAPPIWAIDASGAILGGTISALFTQKKTTLKGTAKAAMVGGVVASTGVVNKLGGFISKFFGA